MPSIFEICGYKIYFWSNENNEPIHVHVSKGKPTQNSTKIWLTKSGGCILSNNSKIPNNDLNVLLDAITSNYFFIVSYWKKFYEIDEIKFYC